MTKQEIPEAGGLSGGVPKLENARDAVPEDIVDDIEYNKRSRKWWLRVFTIAFLIAAITLSGSYLYYQNKIQQHEEITRECTQFGYKSDKFLCCYTCGRLNEDFTYSSKPDYCGCETQVIWGSLIA